MANIGKKATLTELNELHRVVAETLTDAVKGGDLKAMTAAISFLKNNEITVDLMESKEVRSLFSEVKDQIKDADGIESIEDVLDYYKDHK